MDRMLYRDGLSTAVVDRLTEEAGVARGTIYRNFRTRDDLIDTYLRGRHLSTLNALEKIATENAFLNDQIDGIFDYLDALASDDFFRGCPFVVAAAEMPDNERPATQWARTHKQAVVSLFHRMFESHGARRPVQLAEQLAILYDGALITRYLRPDSDAVSQARAMAHLLLAR